MTVTDADGNERTQIGVTGNHPVWSEDRQDFVRVDSLGIGEQLRDTQGRTLKVGSIEPRAGPEQVYNLEVDVEHVYYVSAAGVLVHNAGDKYTGPDVPTPKASNTTRRGVPRDNAGNWRKMRDLWDNIGYDDILSEANRKRISQGRRPVVDDDWIRHFPGDEALRGEKITPHHIDGLPITVPLPKTRHLNSHMPGGFRNNPGGPGMSG